MTKKRLNTKQLQELSEMLSAGKTTAEVASHFNISMATVHNHRTMLKELVSVSGKAKSVHIGASFMAVNF